MKSAETHLWLALTNIIVGIFSLIVGVGWLSSQSNCEPEPEPGMLALALGALWWFVGAATRQKLREGPLLADIKGLLIVNFFMVAVFWALCTFMLGVGLFFAYR